MEKEIIIYLLTVLQLLLTGFLAWLGVTVISLTQSVERLTTTIEQSLSKRIDTCEQRLHDGDDAFEKIRNRLSKLEP